MPVVSTGRLRSLVAWRWFPHVVMFTLALAVRVAWVLAVDRKGFPFNDALMYHSTAENLSHGDGYVPFTGGPTARWPPGFSTVLGGLYWLFGVHPIVGELFNAVVGAVTVVLLMLIAERVLDRGTAIVAGTMLAVLPGPIMWTDVLVSETLYTALFVAALLILVRARPTWQLAARVRGGGRHRRARSRRGAHVARVAGRDVVATRAVAIAGAGRCSSPSPRRRW